jgi:hypothetical protein
MSLDLCSLEGNELLIFFPSAQPLQMPEYFDSILGIPEVIFFMIGRAL